MTVTSATGAHLGPIRSKLHFLIWWCYFHLFLFPFFLIAACLEPLNVILKHFFKDIEEEDSMCLQNIM